MEHCLGFLLIELSHPASIDGVQTVSFSLWIFEAFSGNILWKSRNSRCLIPGRYRQDFKQELSPPSELFSRILGKHFPVRSAWKELACYLFLCNVPTKKLHPLKNQYSHPIPYHCRCVQDSFVLQMTLQAWTSSIIQVAHSGIGGILTRWPEVLEVISCMGHNVTCGVYLQPSKPPRQTPLLILPLYLLLE